MNSLEGNTRMTRKDYVLIAHIINQLSDCIDEMSMAALIDAFSVQLYLDNPRFDADRFAKAAGMTQLEISALLA